MKQIIISQNDEKVIRKALIKLLESNDVQEDEIDRIHKIADCIIVAESTEKGE